MPFVHHELCFGCGRANLFGLMLELEPADEAEAEKIEIPRGPNIKRPPEHVPIEEESLEARVATIQPDDISTGDLAPTASR